MFAFLFIDTFFCMVVPSMQRYTTGGIDMKKQKTTAENLHSRLHKIVGQLQGIDRMLDKGASCEDILVQLNAARSALLSCGKIVLEGQVKDSLANGLDPEEAKTTVERLNTSIERFSSMM